LIVKYGRGGPELIVVGIGALNPDNNPTLSFVLDLEMIIIKRTGMSPSILKHQFIQIVS
jgi:hypothetical protein